MSARTSTDVVNVIKWERLSRRGAVRALLRRHGGVAGGRAGARPAIGSIVFLDAFVPENGDSMADLTSQVVRDNLKAATERGDISVPGRPAAAFLVNEKDQAWVDALCRPAADRDDDGEARSSPARSSGSRKKAYVRAAAYPNPGFDKALERVKADKSWRTYGCRAATT